MVSLSKVTMIAVTQTAFVLAVIEGKTSLVDLLPSHHPVVARKLLISVTASPPYILIFHDEVAQPARVSILHKSRAAAGLESLQNLPSNSALTRACYSTSHWRHFRASPSPRVRTRTTRRPLTITITVTSHLGFNMFEHTIGLDALVKN